SPAIPIFTGMIVSVGTGCKKDSSILNRRIIFFPVRYIYLYRLRQVLSRILLRRDTRSSGESGEAIHYKFSMNFLKSDQGKYEDYSYNHLFDPVVDLFWRSNSDC